MVKKSGKAAPKRAAARVANVAAKKPAATKKAVKQPRTLKPKPKKGLARLKRTKHPVKLPSVYRLTISSSRLLWQHRRLFVGISLVYGLLNLVLVRGLNGNVDVGAVRSSFDQAVGGHPSSLVSGVGTFFALLNSSSGGNGQAVNAYQLFLVLIVSLAIIWALRQVSAGFSVRVRDAYYGGMYPIVPFILVSLVVGLQLIPLAFGSTLYSAVISNGIAIYFAERLVWGIIYALLALITLYMLSSSLFALYIVSLPDMTPVRALKSARQLVRHRRWTVLRKIISLPVILLITAAVILVPVIVMLTPLTQWVFLLLTMFVPLAIHGYMYTLYRELLNE